ncbi:MAG: right-handed parallel beta-helix repeat-containing protein [Planctomycetes bacterium]|nr:right-handed parallel beta-helix repeat-containing protein [Planctomycetota bacterium]MCH9727877.1 right-handed parallel beta-helix repeat-containing protein [Planctomycetota bacterium]MCH9775455.1 right-handed parallel beta-helix repeat-containing protein [Planctomycetota bacterium]MCH9792153.1 right-handed parallel beta-helix repeat-containing protein [Planctomycetota bacterium]
MKIAFRLIAGVIVLAISAMSGTLLAEEEVEFSTIIADGSESSDTLDGISSVIPGNGAGVLFRAGHQAGKTVGLAESISHLEAMPYLFTHTKNPDDAAMIFGGFRLFRTNRGHLGGSAGMGYRFYNYDTDRIVGAGVYYDRDDSTTKTFQQVVLNVETMGRYWDANGNFYMPFGNRQQQLDVKFNEGSQRFSVFNVLYDQTRTIGTAMRGFDAEFGVPVWGEIAKKHEMRAYAGTYNFTATGSKDVWGWRGRLQAKPVPNVLMELSVTNDDTFKTNVFFNVAWTFAGRPEWNKMEKSTQMYRMAERVRRNYNVVVEQRDVVDFGLIAINPATGLPWTISHVDSMVGPGGTGAVLDPYQTIVEAQAGPDRDIIFTHAGSEYNNAAPIVLVAGDRVLGEGQGVEHFIDYQGFGNRLLPNSPLYGSPLRPNSLVRPTFNDTVGDGVILASDSEFSGFILNRPTGRGVVGIGVSSTNVNFVDVNDAVGEGIFLNNTSGSLSFDTTNVTNSAGNAFVVDGGSPSLEYESGTITNTTAGRAVLIQNTTGGFVNMTGSTINDTDSQGILINNVGGGATLDNVTITNSTNEGIHVTGGTANAVVAFRNSTVGSTVIDSATDASLFVENFLGRFSTQNLDILSRNSAGILVESLAGSMEIGGNTTISNGTSLITDHAIDVNNSTGDISFAGTLGITGSTGQGISFDAGSNTGSFRVFGDTSISGTALEAFIVRDDSPVITMGNAILSNTSTTNSVLLLDNAGQGGTAGQVTFGDVNVTGTTGATLPTVHILNNTPSIRFNGLDVITTSAAFPTLAPSVYVQTNPGVVDFGKLDIDATDNLAFIANANTGTIRSSEGTIVVADAAAIDIQDTNIAMRLTSVTAGPTTGANLNVTNGFFLNSAGIRLSNTPGTFTITGDGTIDSGGTITAAQHGVWVEEIESVNIDGLEIQAPITSGIEWHETDVDTVHSMNLTRVRIENSAGDGIVVENGRIFNLVDSILEDNGTDATEHSLEYTVNVELTDTTNDFFTVTLQGNTITDDSADAILLQSGGLLDDTLMNFTLEDQNTITNTASDTDNLAVVWEGPINVLVRNFNNFVGTAPTDNIGININTTSNDLDDTLNFSVINQNNFNISAPNSEGILVNTDGPSNIFIANNNNDLTPAITGQTNIGFVLGGFNSTAIRFQSLAANSNVQIDNNSIDMTNTLSRGVFFDLVNATNSSVQIDGNEFRIFDINGFTEQVIGFNTVLNGPLQIGSGTDNPVFFTPAGGTNGSFLLFNAGGGTFNGQIRVDGTLFP